MTGITSNTFERLGEAAGQPEVHPAGPGLTFAKLAECQHVMEALGNLPLMSTDQSVNPPPAESEAPPPGETATGTATTSPTGQGGWGRAAAGLGTALPSLGQIDKRRLLWVGGFVAAGVGIGSYVAEVFAKSGGATGTPATGATSGAPAGTPATGATSGTPAG